MYKLLFKVFYLITKDLKRVKKMNVDFANRGNYKKKRAKPICGRVFFHFFVHPATLFNSNNIQIKPYTTWTKTSFSDYLDSQ